MDGYNKGNPGVTYERLRAMGNNGVLEPVVGYEENGKLVGTERLYSNGEFGTGDKKARFCAAGWRGWQAAGKEAEMKKFKFWINNGRANIFWQNQFLDQDNDFVQDRFPFPFIEMNPDDMADLAQGRATLSNSTMTTGQPKPWSIRRPLRGVVKLSWSSDRPPVRKET